MFPTTDKVKLTELAKEYFETYLTDIEAFWQNSLEPEKGLNVFSAKYTDSVYMNLQLLYYKLRIEEPYVADLEENKLSLKNDKPMGLSYEFSIAICGAIYKRAKLACQTVYNNTELIVRKDSADNWEAKAKRINASAHVPAR